MNIQQIITALLSISLFFASTVNAQQFPECLSDCETPQENVEGGGAH